MPPKKDIALQSSVRKKISEVKAKYSPLRRASTKRSHVYVIGSLRVNVFVYKESNQ